MADEQWDRLKRLFHEALECAASERSDFVAERCGSDNVLRQRLQTLLASHEQFPDFMEMPPAAEGSALTLSAPLVDEGRLARGDLLDGKYRIERCLGAGGMGVVYKVLHTGLGRGFAAKVIHGTASGDPRFLRRFRVEAEALGGLEHPNIVNVTDFGVDPERNVPYLITEHLEGETLSERLRSSGPLPVEIALPLFDAMAAAIDHAHRHGILHLDLKPANVFLAKREDSDQVKILDFGLAHVMRNDLVADDPRGDDLRLGTPAYLAPELVQGQSPVTHSDIYAFGIVAYEVLTGRTPFEGSLNELLRSHVSDAPVAPSQVHAPLPPELDAAVLSPLKKDPGARPGTAAEVVAGIREASVTAALRKWRQDEVPRRALWAACLALVSLLILSWVSGIDAVERIEGQSLDARFALLPKRPPDPRILLLMIDDETLLADSTPLGLQGDRIGAELQRVFEAGARGIGIDLLLPEAWGRSEGFSQLVLRHADSLTLAAFGTPSGAVIGPECIAGATTAVLGAERASALFGFVNATMDRDGVYRRARLEYLTDDGRARPSWAARAASILRAASDQSADPFLIDRSVDWSQLERVSWKDLSVEVSEHRDRFRDRLVLVGGTYAGSGDEVRVSSRSEAVVPGIILQALAVDSILAGFRVRDVRGWPVLMGVFLAAAAVTAAILCTVRLARALLLVVSLFLAYGTVAFLVFVMYQKVVPVAPPLAAIAVGAVLALVLRLVARPVPSSHTTRLRRPWRRNDDRTRLVAT